MDPFAHVLVTVLAPIVVVAGAGYLVARLGLVEDTRVLSRVSLYLLLPALTFSAMAKSDLRTGQLLALVLFAWIIAGLQGLLGWIVSRRLAFDPSTRSGVLVSVMTVNAGNFGIPLNHFAFGTQAIALATVYYVATLFVTYIGAIFVTGEGTDRLQGPLGRILKMPIAYGAALGLVVNRTGWGVPDLIMRPLQLLGSGAVPIMLTLLGIELARAHMGRERVALSAVLSLRLMVAPMIAFGLAWLMALDGLPRAVAIVQSSMPTAVGAALVAVEFNVRPAFVSGAILVTTLGSFVTLTVLIGLLGH